MKKHLPLPYSQLPFSQSAMVPTQDLKILSKFEKIFIGTYLLVTINGTVVSEIIRYLPAIKNKKDNVGMS